MTNRELLEKAAKAAGMHLTENGVRDLGDWEYLYAGDYKWGLFANNANGTQRMWNPLLDDGDALRLAVKLGIQIRQYPIYDTPRFAAYACEAKWDSDAQRAAGSDALVNYDGDPYAATRRAIVRAAAAIGEHHGS